jgi:FkbH-like protein
LGGQIGESGIEGISVSQHFQYLQQFILGQYKKGMLIALCSKNNEKEVWSVFDNHPGMLLKREHIVEARINWNPKSENLKELARQLNLGLDSFIFIDDNQTECLEVAENCPQVLVLPLPGDQKLFAPFLELMWAFDKIQVTREDRERSLMYKADQQRNSLSHQKSSLKEYLMDLDLKVSMRQPAVSYCERISQLTQRTNQFNLNGKRRDTAVF